MPSDRMEAGVFNGTRLVRRASWAVLATIAMTLIAGSVVLGSHDDRIVLDESKKLAICHATSAQTNPYIQNEPAINSTGYENAAGHADHTGPIWSPGTTEDWGDIIPPYYYEPEDFHFDGLNWTTEGQAIYENDCAIPTGTDTPPPTDVPPTDVPPTDVPPTDLPPTDAPPTDAPPTDAPPAGVPPTPPDTAAGPGAPTPPASSLPLFAVLVLGGVAAILVLFGAVVRRPQR